MLSTHLLPPSQPPPLPLSLRHVILPEDIAEKVPRNRLLTETEWRNLGLQQSRGWVHYMIHKPEPHILLFRRRLPPT